MKRIVMIGLALGASAVSQVAFAQQTMTAPAAPAAPAGQMMAPAPQMAPPPAMSAPSSPNGAVAGQNLTIPSNTPPAPNGVTIVPFDPGRPQQNLAKPSTEAPTMFRQGLVGVLGSFSDSPTILGAVTPIDHAFVGLGFQFTYNGNGIGATNPISHSTKVSAAAVLAGEYMLIDKVPFAMGPEVTLLGSLAGGVFNTFVVEPGVAFWYLPWKAPFVVGSALDMEIVTTAGAKPVVTFLTPGVRAGYIFN